MKYQNRQAHEVLLKQRIRQRRLKGVGILLGLFLLAGLGVKAALSSKRLLASSVPTTEVQQTPLREHPIAFTEAHEPLSVLLLGLDSGALGRGGKEDGYGRSDVMLLATLNPKTKRITLTSLPRDTLVTYQGRQEKLNHMFYFGGYGLAANTVQQLLHIPIDYVATVDMGGFDALVDACGGVDIVADATFEENGDAFEKGHSYHLTGDTALSYVRNRSDSDYGRQARQRQVFMALAKKVLKHDLTSTQFFTLARQLLQNVSVNASMNDLLDLYKGYGDIGCSNIQAYQLQGRSAFVGGASYEVVDGEALAKAQARLQAELEQPHQSIERGNHESIQTQHH